MKAPKHIYQLITKIKKLIDNNTIIVEDFKNQLTAMDRSSKQKINKETMALNDTLHWMDLTYIQNISSKAAEYTFFSHPHGTFSRIDHILGDNLAFNKYKQIGVIPCIFPDHNTMKLEINHKKKFGKTTDTWRLILLRNEWVNQEIKEEIKNYMETNENDNTTA